MMTERERMEGRTKHLMWTREEYTEGKGTKEEGNEEQEGKRNSTISHIS